MAEMKILTASGLEYLVTKIDANIDGKVDKVDGKTLTTNDYTTAEKNKLAGIATSAQVNKIETVKLNGTALTISSKAVNIDLSAYALKSDLSSAIKWKGTVEAVSNLPTTGNTTGDMRHVNADGSEYIWNGTAWEFVGKVIDLSPYYTKSEVNTALGKKADTSSLATVATTGSYNDLTNKPSIPKAVTVDSALSTSSTNPVQNKVVANALNTKLNSADLVAVTNAEIDALFS